MDSKLIFMHYCSGVTNDGGTQEGRPTDDWKCLAAIRGGSRRQIREVITLRKAGKRAFGQANWLILRCQEKPLVSHYSNRTADRHR